MNKISILNGHLIDPANNIDIPTDIHIANGKILALGAAPVDFQTSQTIDASGLTICPGLVDLNARMREPGHEHKATIASETAAAAKGGITTLCCPPDTDPIIDTPAVAEMIQRKAQQSGLCRILPIGATTKGLGGEKLSEMAALQNAGCVALSNALTPISNTLVERRVLEYAATFGITVFLRPEDPHLSNGGCAHEGSVATRLGLPGIPSAAETVAVARDLALAEHTGCKIHFRGLSCGTAVRKIRLNKIQVSADVAAHQLFLTEDDLEGFNSNCHVRPPLRTNSDREALRKGVADGIISAICSGHQPHEPDAKEAPFPSTAPGISGLETLLPLTLRLVAEGVLDLPQALARITCGPADILGLPLGRLDVGTSADICIFNPEQHWQLTTDKMLSRGHNTPFLGQEFRGEVTHTLFEGRLVYCKVL
ncbi:Dihydroorotase [hydrothermal vent metagenome]|uniref:Dihydroorotase n=1 Tax=hydrothermal vent metagenome TaxID=652676 RepID=A0A3B1ARX3_9ZZZZ